jgi:four helix bundle protein
MEIERPARIKSYGDLKVYQLSYQLALEIHRMTLKFPAIERVELASQLRRAAMSVPIHIAEGYGRKKSAENFKRFPVIAMGSCNEVSVILDLSHDLGYFSKEIHAELKNRYDQVGRTINKLIQVWK